MAADIPLERRLSQSAQLAKRAAIFHDIWFYYEGANTRSSILDTMQNYSEFFRFDAHAHFIALVVHLYALFESRSNTINFPSLVREAERSEVFSAEAIIKAKGILAIAEPLFTKVSILRNNLFGHRSAHLSYKEAFTKAAISPDQLRELAAYGLQIANLLLNARGLAEQEFHSLSLEHTKRLLSDLKAS
ncbi:MAG: hypothetical protein JNK40_08490 [Chromatiales bacterium]|nr:hypothetical protein [Chromatiales bacterium]